MLIKIINNLLKLRALLTTYFNRKEQRFNNMPLSLLLWHKKHYKNILKGTKNFTYSHFHFIILCFYEEQNIIHTSHYFIIPWSVDSS